MRLGNEATVSAGSTESVEDAIDRPRIARALAELDPDQRDVLLLHVWAELSHVEIATCWDPSWHGRLSHLQSLAGVSERP